MIKAFFAALFETIAEVVKTIAREDKKGVDSDNDKNLRNRFNNFMRHRVRDDSDDIR